MLNKQNLVLIPGIILAFVLYTLSQGLNNIIGIELLGYEKSPISTAMIAILLGIFFGNIFKFRQNNWQSTIEFIKTLSKISLTMAMAAIGLSTNLRDIRQMGYKPFLVGFIGMSTVGIVSVITIELYFNFFNF